MTWTSNKRKRLPRMGAIKSKQIEQFPVCPHKPRGNSARGKEKW